MTKQQAVQPSHARPVRSWAICRACRCCRLRFCLRYRSLSRARDAIGPHPPPSVGDFRKYKRARPPRLPPPDSFIHFGGGYFERIARSERIPQVTVAFKFRRAAVGKELGMHQRTFGRDPVRVSEVGLGTWQFGGSEWGSLAEDDAIAALRAAAD